MKKFITVEDIRTLEFGLTTLCNAGCPLCNRHIAGTSTPIPQLEFKSITVENFAAITVGLGDHTKHINLSFAGIWGDPMMHPHILDILDIADKHYASVYIDTNGGMRDSDFWKRVAQYKHVKVAFSIDGLADTNHIYRINTDYNRIINNASAYIANGGVAVWKFIIFKHNEHQVEIARQTAKQLGFSQFKTHVSKRFELPSHSVEKSAYKAKINKKLNVDSVVIAPSTNVDSQQLLYNQSEFDTNINCKSIEKGYLYISEDARLWPCCYFETVLPYSQKFQRYWAHVENLYGSNFNSTVNNSIEKLLEHEYFAYYLPASWTDNNLERCHQCPIKCGSTLYRNNIESVQTL